MKVVVDGVEYEVPRLTESQERSLLCFAEHPTGGYYGTRLRTFVRARTEVISRLGLIVPNEPRGTGWSLTPLGRAVAQALASRVPS